MPVQDGLAVPLWPQPAITAFAGAVINPSTRMAVATGPRERPWGHQRSSKPRWLQGCHLATASPSATASAAASGPHVSDRGPPSTQVDDRHPEGDLAAVSLPLLCACGGDFLFFPIFFFFCVPIFPFILFILVVVVSTVARLFAGGPRHHSQDRPTKRFFALTWMPDLTLWLVEPHTYSRLIFFVLCLFVLFVFVLYFFFFFCLIRSNLPFYIVS